MATSIIKKPINMNMEKIGEVSNADNEKTITLSKSITNFAMIAFVYNVGKCQILTTPELFETLGNIKSSADATNFMQITYVSNTTIKVLTTQGSKVTVYGLN